MAPELAVPLLSDALSIRLQSIRFFMSLFVCVGLRFHALGARSG